MGRYLTCPSNRLTRDEKRAIRAAEREKRKSCIDNTIRVLARAGHDIGRISARVDRSVRYCRLVMRDAGMQARPYRRSIAKPLLWLHRGLSVREVSEKLGISIEAVRWCRREARDAGWPI